MIAVISVLFIAMFFITASRVATIALVGTGMSTDAANFQARSALMGVGYTTSEAEDAINHPVRRKIILWLMTFGNAGIITGISSLVLGFIDAEVSETALRATTLALGLVILVLLTRWRWLERPLARFTRFALARWTSLDTRDLANMLRFGHDFGIVEIYAHSGDWMVDRPLADLHLPNEGILILGVHRRGGEFIGAPRGRTIIHDGDTVVAYGQVHHLDEIDDRMAGRSGDQAHMLGVKEQAELLKELEALDEDA